MARSERMWPIMRRTGLPRGEGPLGASVDVSVIIPTCGRPRKLAACVGALAAQAYEGRFEVLVGTDGPDAGAASAAQGAWAGAKSGRLDVVQCAKAGPGPTRNRLIELATGKLLLLLNDDVVPDRGLLAAHVAAHRGLEGREAMVLGAAPWRVHEPDSLFDRLIRETSMVFFYDQMTDEPGRDWGFRHAWTLNLSLPAATARAVGAFDESLRCACFEDLEFAWRLGRHGLPVLHRPGAVVVHDHRYTPRGYLEREHVLGREAWLLAGAAPECAREIFGRDVRSREEVEYSRLFVDREAKAAERLERSFVGLEEIPAGAVGGAEAKRIIGLVYEQHLLLKRWWWRRGLVEAAVPTSGTR